MTKEKITIPMRNWYGRAYRYCRENKRQISPTIRMYFCSWWLSVEYDIDTPKINRVMNQLVKLGYLTKESKVGLYTKYTFTDKEMNDA